MPFIKEGKTNLKYILIVVVLGILAGGGILVYYYWWIADLETRLGELEMRIPEVKVPEETFLIEPSGIEKLKKTIIFSKDLGNKVQVFELSPQLKDTRLLFEVEKPPLQSKYQLERESPKFQVAENGIIAYSLTDNKISSIFIWDGQSVKKIYQKAEEAGQSLPSFNYSLSPDGKTILLVDSNFLKSTLEETIVNQKFYKFTLENPEPQFLYEESTTAGFDAETRYIIVGWSGEQNPRALLQKKYSFQLGGYNSGFFELDITTKKLFPKLPLEKKTYIARDQDYKNLVVAIEDTACCGGLNYSNDQTFTVVLPRGVESKIFDEYSTFHNEEKAWTEQHYTANAYFSPDSKYIVQTIQNVYRKCTPQEKDCEGRDYQNPPSLLVTNLSGEKIFSKEGAEALGWVDSTNLLVRRDVIYIPKPPVKWALGKKSNGIAMINIETGKQTNILNGDFNEAWILK